MNYLRITNAGLICPEDLTLIGSSTKREQTGKIGMFGSGWKYALAWLIRNECTPVIYSGTEQIKVDYKVKLHRDNPVNIITVNGEETSLTTSMGPKWTGWMALREIISNAIDEGQHTIMTQWMPEMQGVADQTVVWLPMNGELSEVMMRWDSYFSFNRRVSYTLPSAKVYVKSEASPLNIYRKGIRCLDTKDNSIIDWDFTDISINEDRLCQSYSVTYKIRDCVSAGVPTPLLKLILETCDEDCCPVDMTMDMVRQCKEIIDMGHTFTTSSLQKLGGMMFAGENAITIRAEWYKKLNSLGLVKSPFEMFGDENENFIRTDEKDVSQIKYYLSGIGINMEIRSGKCEKESFVNNGIGYIKDTSFTDDKLLAAKIIKRMSDRDLASILK